LKQIEAVPALSDICCEDDLMRTLDLERGD
jgi:hypothetical protein